MENSRVCRICITESAVMLSLFGDDALWRKIISFANIEIQENDSLPQQICTRCAKEAISASSLKQQCEDADRYFRRIVEVSGLTRIFNNMGDIEVKNEPVDTYENNVDSNSMNYSPQTVGRSSLSSISVMDVAANRLNSIFEPSAIRRESYANRKSTPNLGNLESQPIVANTFPSMISIPIRNNILVKDLSPPPLTRPQLIKRFQSVPSLTNEVSSSTTKAKDASPSRKNVRKTNLSLVSPRKSKETSSSLEPNQPSNLTIKRPRKSALSTLSSPSRNKKSVERSRSMPSEKIQNPVKWSSTSANITASQPFPSTSNQQPDNIAPPKLTSSLLPTSNGLSRPAKCPCEVCGESFLLKRMWKHHMKTSHPDSLITFQCWKCKRSYSTKRFLDNHLENGVCTVSENSSKLQHRCIICRRVFPSKKHLTWHKRVGHCSGITKRRGRKPAILKQDKLDEMSKLTAQSRPFKMDENGPKLQVLDDANKIQVKHVSLKKETKRLNNNTPHIKRKRKPYVFMDDAKFEEAKIHVHNTPKCTIAALARHLNTSTITAWRARQCILLGVPFIRKRNHKNKVNPVAAVKRNSLPAKLSDQSDELDKIKCEKLIKTPKEDMTMADSKSFSSQNGYDVPETSGNCNLSGPSIVLDGLLQSSFKTSPVRKREDIEQSQTISTPMNRSTSGKSLQKIKIFSLSRDERGKIIDREIQNILKENAMTPYAEVSNRLAQKGLHLAQSSICRRIRLMGVYRRSPSSSSKKKL